MPSIVSYQKFIDSVRTRELSLPMEAGTTNRQGQELCTIDGTTYVSLPDGAALPTDQPAEIKASIKTVVLTDALRDQIKAAAPLMKYIDQRVKDRIRSRYTVDDEIKCLRLAPSDETVAWNAYVEECREWGRQERAKYGV